MKKTLALILALVMMLSMAVCVEAAPAAEAADLVLKNGEIQTMVEEGDIVQAVAVADGRFVYVGDDAGVEAFIGENTTVIDLEGKYVTPGFIDGHIHEPGNYLGLGDEISFYDVPVDLEAYKAALREFVEANPDFDIYLGSSMDLKAFPNSNPSNEWLDEICSDKPICISDMSGHGKLLNSVAIEMTGYTRESADPPSGTIYHDANGELTGYFSDCPIEGLPGFTYDADDYYEAFAGFQDEAHSYGITGIISGGASPMTWDAAIAMEKEGKLGLRYFTDIFVDEGVDSESTLDMLMDYRENAGSEYMMFEMVKYKVDGVPEGKSAYLLEPYAPEAEMPADYVSSAACTQEELNELTAMWNAAGFQMETHCMGDAAVNMALNAYEYSAEVNDNNDFRNQIAHVTLITEEDMVRMADLGVIGAMQPLWFYYDPFFSPLEEQMFGTERFNTEYHMREFEDIGIVVTGSNDYPVTADFAPLHAMEAGVTQCSPYPGQDTDIETFTRNADQGVTPYEALCWYTTNGAYAMFRENELGTIEVGKLADMVVLGYNILTCDVKEISDAPVLCTISGGRIVFEG